MTEETTLNETKKRRPKAEDLQVTEDTDTVLDTTTELGVFKLTEHATVPEFGTEESACFDLAASFEQGEAVVMIANGVKTFRRVTDTGLAIHPGERFLIPTGLVFDIPAGYCIEIYPRSGISFKSGLNLSNCTAIIDSDYVEQTFVSLNNFGNESQYIKTGDRIAQAKLVELVKTSIVQITTKPTQKTSRSGGFGSTGK